ncbi:cellulase family glycosylhydrolase [Frankia sp. AgB32]|uniref:cellulase family glycosylhydrolase n=1 Tax=Frankia sp. AgB32 TaxID=631119 RepID=UPI002010AE38|nr:cellulase family glycosylhydrolase [Frankia sp. AgB32]MCK9893721.1 cellulase family glycosylhydrolase [Frankia sp. AgB32]
MTAHRQRRRPQLAQAIRRRAGRLLLAGVLLVVGLAGSAAGEEYSFVGTSGGQLTLDGGPARLAGLNVWNANENPQSRRYCGTPPDLSAAGSEFGPGVRAVRIWFFQRLATTPDGVRDWTTFDNTLHAAAMNHLRVIAVLGNQWADCEGYDSAEAGYKTEQWYRQGYWQDHPPGQPATYLEWAREVVDRYQNDPTIMLWQMVNEPEDAVALGGSCPSDASEVLRAFVQDVGRQIKAIDNRHLLGMGTVGSGQCGTAGGEYVDLNADQYIDIADYHDYSLDVVPGDQWNGLATRAREMTELGKPLIIGEMGVIPSQVGGVQARAALLGSKIYADFQLGVQGALLWAWRPAALGGTNPDGYDIGPGDPVLDQLTSLTS